MDEGEAGAVSSSGAAGETDFQNTSASRKAEQQKQAQDLLQQQQPQQAQQLMTPIQGARNYGYPDDFMMYGFKVEACTRTDKHPRGSCPYAHPGDVARRRHPSRYEALLCPEVRAKKVCPRMDECQCSHSAFEFWLHPDRYRTSMCEKGVRCSRPVCFFAHTAEELRPLPAGLKPAVPDEAGSSSSKRGVGSSSSSGNVMWQMPGGSVISQLHPACFPAGYGGGVRYVQQQAAQPQPPQQPVLLQPGMQLVPVAAAGAAAGGGYAPVGYMPVQMPAGVEGSMVQPGMQYAQPQGRYYAPAAAVEQQSMQRGGAPVLVMPAAPQQQQFVLQPAAVQPPSQLPEVMQQFQGLLVSSGPMTPQHHQQQQYAHISQAAAGQWQHASGHQQHGYEHQQQMVMVMQQGSSGPQQQQVPGTVQQQQPQTIYLQGGMDSASWPQGLQQQQQPYMRAGSYPSAAAASSSAGYQRQFAHQTHAQHQQRASSHSAGGAGSLPRSAPPAPPAAAVMHVPMAAVPLAAGGQPPPPAASAGSTGGVVLGAQLLHQGSQHLTAPAATGSVDAVGLPGVAAAAAVLHQPGGMVPSGEPQGSAVGPMLAAHGGIGLNMPGGGMQGQQGNPPGW